MKKEYKLTIYLVIIIVIFISFGTAGFKEIEKISNNNVLIESHGSQALTFLESARKKLLKYMN